MSKHFSIEAPKDAWRHYANDDFLVAASGVQFAAIGSTLYAAGTYFAGVSSLIASPFILLPLGTYILAGLVKTAIHLAATEVANDQAVLKKTVQDPDNTFDSRRARLGNAILYGFQPLP